MAILTRDNLARKEATSFYWHFSQQKENLSQNHVCVLLQENTHSVLNIRLFYLFQYKPYTDVYRHILEYRFTHIVLYVVCIEISKKAYI